MITSYADGVLTWSPSATDTLLVGVGQLEIRVTYGDVVGKSVRIVTYTFVTALGSPATNNAQVLIQTLSNTVKKLAEAIRGIQDVANNAYGLGTSSIASIFRVNSKHFKSSSSVISKRSMSLMPALDKLVTKPFISSRRNGVRLCMTTRLGISEGLIHHCHCKTPVKYDKRIRQRINYLKKNEGLLLRQLFFSLAPMG